MKIISTIIVLIFTALVAGCAGTPQQPVYISENFWQSPDKKIGIIMSEVPAADVHLPGAACLLCIAVAEAANSSISKQVKDFSTESLHELPKSLAETLDKNHIPYVVIEEQIKVSALPKLSSKVPNTPKKDFSAFQSEHGITHLLVVDISLIGITRSYANYIPTSDPKGSFQAASYLVDLSNNTYTWYKPVSIQKSVVDGWDEPPTFPGLTNAYYQAIELGKEAILEPFMTVHEVFEAEITEDTNNIPATSTTAGKNQAAAHNF